MPDRSYIVICAQVVGGTNRPFEIVYGWDGSKFDTRQQAIRFGCGVRGSDDFNIGVVERGCLTEFCWMDQPMHESDRAELSNIAEQIGLRCEVSHA